MRRAGQTPRGDKLWTDDERRVVRDLYPDYRALMKALPRRSYYALRNEARALGVVQHRHRWTAADRSKLRRLYPGASWSEVLASLPAGLTKQQIKARARDFGIRRRLPLSPTGFPVIDSIRNRATQLQWSMIDLDKMARTRNYFAKAKWFNAPAPNYRAVEKAIRALGGRMDLQVRWE